MKLREYFVRNVNKNNFIQRFLSLLCQKFDARSQQYYNNMRVFFIWMHGGDWHGEEKKLLKKVIIWILFSLHTKSILIASQHYGWTPDCHMTILIMS